MTQQFITTNDNRVIDETAIANEASSASSSSGGKGAASVDLMSVYYSQIGKVSLLTAAEEVRLAKLMEAGKAAAERLAEAERVGETLASCERERFERAKARGLEARRRFIEANLRLVVSIAKRYQNRGLSLEDLIEEGNAGLIKAVDKFDYRRGCKFSTHATWWIRQAVSRGAAEQGRTVRLPVHQVERIGKLKRIQLQLQQELKREPSNAELAYAMGLAEDDVRDIKAAQRETLSLDKPVGEDEDASLGDLVEDGFATDPAQEAEAAALQHAVHAALDRLPDRERRVIALRFGIGCDGPRTLEQVGREIGLSRERVRQIEAKAISYLKASRNAKDLREFVA